MAKRASLVYHAGVARRSSLHKSLKHPVGWPHFGPLFVTPQHSTGQASRVTGVAKRIELNVLSLFDAIMFLGNQLGSERCPSLGMANGQ